MNYQATIINCLTAGYPEGANLPVHFETDREVIEAALKIIGHREPEAARVMRIRNTLTLTEMELSEPCLSNGPAANPLTMLETARPLKFAEDGNLPPLQ
jgi:hypothetical protein